MNLSEPFIRRPVMTVVLTRLGHSVRRARVSRLPVNDLPAVDYPVIQVQVDYPGRHARDDGEQRRHAARAAVHADSRAGAGHLQQHAGQHQLHAAVRSVDKSLDAAATDVQAAITQATGQLPVDLPCPPTFTKTNPTISRSCTSR